MTPAGPGLGGGEGRDVQESVLLGEDYVGRVAMRRTTNPQQTHEQEVGGTEPDGDARTNHPPLELLLVARERKDNRAVQKKKIQNDDSNRRIGLIQYLNIYKVSYQVKYIGKLGKSSSRKYE